MCTDQYTNVIYYINRRSFGQLAQLFVTFHIYTYAAYIFYYNKIRNLTIQTLIIILYSHNNIIRCIDLCALTNGQNIRTMRTKLLPWADNVYTDIIY